MIDVLFTPADFGRLSARDLRHTTCVVFDILRGTTSIVAALANGAAAVIPVAEISEALALRAQQPEVLLAGERQGLRIRAAQTGGIDFELGNSPREYTAAQVKGRTIVTTTTNGTRALRACAQAQTTLVGSFRNLTALAGWIKRHPPQELLIVCSGTGEEAAYEDVLAAGALLEKLNQGGTPNLMSDAALMALRLWEQAQEHLLEAVSLSRNGRRLLAMPALASDVPFCLQHDTAPLVAVLRAGLVSILREPPWHKVC